MTTSQSQASQESQPFVVNVVNSEPFSEKGEVTLKSPNPTTTTTNICNPVPEQSKPVDSPTTTRLQRLQTDHKIPNGSPVKIHDAESKQDASPTPPTSALTETETVTSSDVTERQIIDWNELLEAMDKEMKRLCWGVNDGRAYLQHKYQKKSRQSLTDEEALEFYQFLTERKTGYLVGERVVVSHADTSLNGQLAKVISVKPNHILEIEFAGNRQLCEVSALHVTLSSS